MKQRRKKEEWMIDTFKKILGCVWIGAINSKYYKHKNKEEIRKKEKNHVPTRFIPFCLVGCCFCYHYNKGCRSSSTGSNNNNSNRFFLGASKNAQKQLTTSCRTKNPNNWMYTKNNRIAQPPQSRQPQHPIFLKLFPQIVKFCYPKNTMFCR